ncbi:MAG: hypothetical protein ABJ242_05110 [Marinomonas sp.]
MAKMAAKTAETAVRVIGMIATIIAVKIGAIIAVMKGVLLISKKAKLGQKATQLKSPVTLVKAKPLKSLQNRAALGLNVRLA